jgi:hypothetical protein
VVATRCPPLLTECVPPPDGTICPIAVGSRLESIRNAPQLAFRRTFQMPNASTRLTVRQA